MTSQTHMRLVGFKKWADGELYEIIGRSLDQLDATNSSMLVRILDHILVVDQIFRSRLEGKAPLFAAPRSDELPDFAQLDKTARDVDEWYVSYVENLGACELDELLEFNFTSGKPARMTRGEIIEHVCLHGTYHRGNAGVVLQTNGIRPNDDRLTDFLELAA